MSDVTDVPDNPPDALIRGEAPDLALPREACLFEGLLSPCTVVIFGASGDLTSGKLMPALFNLFLNSALPKPCRILGCARSPMSDEEFRSHMAANVQAAGYQDLSRWPEFAANLNYLTFEYADFSSYVLLSNFLQDLERQAGTGGNRIFYLAVPPAVYSEIGQMLGQAGLGEEGARGQGWFQR